MRAPSQTKGPSGAEPWAVLCSLLLCAGAPACTAPAFILSPPPVKGPFLPQCYQIFTLHWVIFLPCSPKGFFIGEQRDASVAQEQNLLAQFIPFGLLNSGNSAGCQEPTQAALSSGGTCPSTGQSGALRKWKWLPAQGYTSASCKKEIDIIPGET